MSGSAWILAMTSQRMMPYANTSTCSEGKHKVSSHYKRLVYLQVGLGTLVKK